MRGSLFVYIIWRFPGDVYMIWAFPRIVKHFSQFVSDASSLSIHLFRQLQASGIHGISLLPLESAEHVDQLRVQSLGLGDGLDHVLCAQKGQECLQHLVPGKMA